MREEAINTINDFFSNFQNNKIPSI